MSVRARPDRNDSGNFDSPQYGPATEPSGGEKAVQAQPAAHVEDGLTGAKITEAERVADAAERFCHRRRQGVDLLRIVAELLGAGRADRELLLLIGRTGDLGETPLHGGMDFFGA
jgi:hypothetical protein